MVVKPEHAGRRGIPKCLFHGLRYLWVAEDRSFADKAIRNVADPRGLPTVLFSGTTPLQGLAYGDLIGRKYVDLPGVNEVGTLPVGLFANKASGSVAVVAGSAPAAAVHLVSEFDTDVVMDMRLSSTDNKFVVEFGPGSDPGPAVEFFEVADAVVVWASFQTFGVDWDAAATNLFVDGRLRTTGVGYNTGTSANAAKIGLYDSTYSAIGFHALGVWDRPLTESRHRVFDKWIKRGRRD